MACRSFHQHLVIKLKRLTKTFGVRGRLQVQTPTLDGASLGEQTTDELISLETKTPQKCKGNCHHCSSSQDVPVPSKSFLHLRDVKQPYSNIRVDI